MSGQVQELIDKIKSEGFAEADKQAKEVEVKAQKEAERIVSDANAKADQMVTNAKEEIKKMKESTEMALKQASRDTLLSLRKQIEQFLGAIMTAEAKESLSGEQLAGVLTAVIESAASGKEVDVEVTVSKNDLKKIKDTVVAKLKKKLEKPVQFKSSDDMGGGFTISFDGGKSSFDFTDESLAQYLSTFLNAQVATLLKEAVN